MENYDERDPERVVNAARLLDRFREVNHAAEALTQALGLPPEARMMVIEVLGSTDKQPGQETQA